MKIVFKISLLLLFLGTIATARKCHANSVEDSLLKVFSKTIETKSFKEIESTYEDIANNYANSNPNVIIKLSWLYINKAFEDKKYRSVSGAFGRIGTAYFILGYYENAIKYSTIAADILTNNGEEKGTGYMQIDIGNILFQNGNINGAIRQYKKALYIFKEYPNIFGLTVVFNNLGLCYQKLNEFDLSLKYFQASLHLRLKLGNPYLAVHIYHYIAENYFLQKDFANAKKTLIKATQFISKHQDIHNPDAQISADIDYFWGIYYDLLNEHDSAYAHFLNFAKTHESIYVNNLKASSGYSLAAQQLYNLKKFPEAINMAKYGLRLATEINDRKNSLIANEVLYKSYEKLGDSKNAFSAYKKYTELYDFMNSKSLSKKINLVEEGFLIKENENKLAVQNAKYETLIAKEKNQILVNWIITGLSAVSLVILILVLRLFWLTKNNNTLLVQKNLVIEEKSKELESANKTKDVMMSVIAHDLRNPIHSMIGFADLIEKESNKNTESAIVKYAKIVQNSGRQSSYLLENLLQWYQSQSGKLDFNPTEFSMHDNVDKCLLLLKGMSESKGINICINLIDYKLFTDELMFQTIIRNILTNAMKFVPVNGLIRISSQINDESLIIIIEDDGPGFEVPLQVNFSNEPSVNSNESLKGSGLGLALCRNFVEKLNGTIVTGKSELGGARVEIQLPFQIVRGTLEQNSRLHSEDHPQTYHLSIDDVILIRNVLSNQELPKIYEATKWRKIIEQLKQIQSENGMVTWIEKLEKAIYVANSSELDDLMNDLKVNA